MTLTIELTVQEEAQLTEVARRQGMGLNDLAKALVTAPILPRKSTEALPEGVSPDHFYFRATPEEFKRALDEISEMNRDLPPFPPEALDRESIYSDD